MTTVQAEKIARRKLSLLQLAQELGNVTFPRQVVTWPDLKARCESGTRLRRGSPGSVRGVRSRRNIREILPACGNRPRAR